MNTCNRAEEGSSISLEGNSWTRTGADEKIHALLTNSEFVLLYVPKGGGMMRLVRPAMDPSIREKLRYRSGGLRFYALSHLWGISNEEKNHLWDFGGIIGNFIYKNHKKNYKKSRMWDVGSFIHDEDGDPVQPIPMRAEKRDTLLALLKKKSGYWWIDVLCARVTTPLGIMGSIYRYCNQCYAMIDCEPRILYDLSSSARLKDMKIEYERVSAEDKHEQATLSNKWIENWSEELQLMHQLTQCRWFKRVWTWQEATLPWFTYLIPETSGNEVMEYRVSLSRFTWMQSLAKLEEPHIARVLPKDTLKKLRIISNLWREIYEAMEYKETTEFSFGPSASKFVDAIAALGASTRICMDPVDYVYGVLGSLDLNVDRMKDHRAVWESFLKKLDKLIRWVLEYDQDRYSPGSVKSISISDKAYNVDLSMARSMAHVYDGLLDVTYEDIPVATSVNLTNYSLNVTYDGNPATNSVNLRITLST